MEFLASSKSWSPLRRLARLLSNPLGLQSLGYHTAAMISGLCFHPCEFHPTLARSGKPRAPRARLSMRSTSHGKARARGRRAARAGRRPSEQPFGPKTLQANRLLLPRESKRQSERARSHEVMPARSSEKTCRVLVRISLALVRRLQLSARLPPKSFCCLQRSNSRGHAAAIAALSVCLCRPRAPACKLHGQATVIHKYLFASWFLGSPALLVSYTFQVCRWTRMEMQRMRCHDNYCCYWW